MNDTLDNMSPWPIGKTVADFFEIRSILGRGGMGIVYKAYDNATMQDVAVKVPLGSFVESENARKRFTNEAEAWTNLIHPNIVRAFDVRDDEGTDYQPAIFMDYCDGGSLADLIHLGQTLPIACVIDIAIQICWGMAFAHEKGHIHRDLKPGNILLTTNGCAMVSDFGLVKQLRIEDYEYSEETPADLGGDLRASLTQGSVVGTPLYMAPEQLLGQPELRSDIYSFGVMLYQLCCGYPPFMADNYYELAYAHLEVTPKNPRTIKSGIPEDLADLIMVCLAKSLSDRPDSFHTVFKQLVGVYEDVTGQCYSDMRNQPTEEVVSKVDKQANAWSLIRLGNGCHRRGDLDDAERQFCKASEIFCELNDKNGLSACLGNRAVILQNRGTFEAAMVLHKQQERICRGYMDKNGLSINLGNQACILISQGKLNAAMVILVEQGHLCREIEDNQSLSLNLGNQAAIQHIRGELNSAMTLLEEGEHILRELGDKGGLQKMLGNKAVILRDQGELDEAMMLHKEQETTCRELGDRHWLSNCLGNQALIHTYRGELDRAMALHKECEALCRELDDNRGLSKTLGNQAVILINRFELESAMELLLEQERICHKLGDKQGLSVCLGNQGLILVDQGRSDVAIVMYREQERICRELRDKHGLSVSIANRASILIQNNDLEEAMKLLVEQEQICLELGDKQGLAASYCNQAEILKKQGGIDAAILLHKKGEFICRQVGEKNGLSRSLSNQAIILIQDMGNPRGALPLVEEAYGIAVECGFADLTEQAKVILEYVRGILGLE